jgi:hypothetical protein
MFACLPACCHLSQGGPLFTSLTEGTATFVQFFAFTYETIFFVDVVWATPGYILSCKLFDTHVRSAEPTFLGECSNTQHSTAQHGSVYDRAQPSRCSR